MANTEVWYPENAQVYVYNHIEKEFAGSTIDGSNLDFTLDNAPSPILGSYFNAEGSAISQYVDANGSVARRDFTVYKRKSGADAEWDTTSDGSVIIKVGDATGSVIAFETAPTTTQADNILVTYGHTKNEKSDEVLSVSDGGGDRPVDYIQVYNGKQIKTSKTQQNFTVDLEVLKGGLSFAEMVNGAQVSEGYAGSGSIYTVTGGDKRADRVLVIDGDDPDTGNRMIFVYWNVSGVGKSLDAPSEEKYTETVNFSTKSSDKVEVLWQL